MVKSGKVSVWIGDIISEDELLDYVDDGAFGSDYDFKVTPRAKRELSAGTAFLPVVELIEGFSWWELFAEKCAARASELGITKGKCMVVFYAFEYMPSPSINAGSPLKFIGSFDF